MLPSLSGPELFFGLCSPLGTDNKKVADLITDRLKRYSYDTEYFKITDLMKSIVLKDMKLRDSHIEERYDFTSNTQIKSEKFSGSPTSSRFYAAQPFEIFAE